jgi:hypothetical protein
LTVDIAALEYMIELTTQAVFCCLGNDRLLVVDDGLKLCSFEDMIADMFLIVFPIAVPLSG